MTTRRRIEVGADGMADVLCLTDPIPRHLSIVSWGANDRPATSWKSANPDMAPQEVLRTFPADAVDVAKMNLQRVQGFIGETLDALVASYASVLKNPLRSADRGAQVRALTSQAGARIAAFATAVAPLIAGVTKTYKTAGLTLPDPPTSSTLQGELDRRQFMASAEQASAAITDMVLSLMRDSGGFATATEGILSLFGQVGSQFAQFAASMPDGVVGVVQTPDATENAGRRNKTTDQSKLNTILTLLQELGAELPTSTENVAMSITIADLQRLAEENPVGFMTAVKTAMEVTKNRAPEIVQKFVWGESGVSQHDPAAILAELGSFQSGDALLSMITGAVAGIDVGTMAEKDNTQVASTMRSALATHVTESIKADPNGELAQSIKAALAPHIAGAVADSMKMVLQGMQGSGSDSTPFGMGSFSADDSDPLAVALPSASRIAGQ